MVTLLVGEDEVPFYVHMDILCRASSFFEAAFMGSGDFVETSKHSMDLPEDDPEAFEYLIQWLYFKKFLMDKEAERELYTRTVEARREANSHYLKLARLYVTADKYCVNELRNEVIDQFYRLQNGLGPRTIPNYVVDYVYANTNARSQLRRLLVANWTWHRRIAWYLEPGTEEILSRRSPDFATDIIISMAARIIGGPDPFETGNLQFHEGLEAKIGANSGADDSTNANGNGDTSFTT